MEQLINRKLFLLDLLRDFCPEISRKLIWNAR